MEDKPQELQMWRLTTGLKDFFQVSVVTCTTMMFMEVGPFFVVYALETHGKHKMNSVECVR